ncbi:MAG: hypothetical protein JO301_09345 [Chitinophagaceae bacterium]|nr:hypothetical protein [Chitinophagaceae bacterium]
MPDSVSSRTIPKAVFSSGQKNYAIDARYLFREFREGERVTVIYETQDLSKAAVYSVWGYWIRWQELLGSIAALVILFQVAVAITRNPTPEAVIDQMESGKESTRKYMD